MTAPYLPEDCIHDILKHLQNHHLTLFNCLFINRFWCRTTVPLLYADPFLFKLNKNNSSIISTLISCFSKEEILKLKNQLELINIDDKINTNDEYKPLFEYPKYLENFDHDKTRTAIFHWLNLPPHEYNPQYIELFETFIQTFYHSILYRIISIKQLNISLDLFKNWSVQTNLTKLISLKLNLGAKNDKISPEILSIIANDCLNLRKLEIVRGDYIDTDNNNKRCTLVHKRNNHKETILALYSSRFINSSFFSLEFKENYLVYTST